MEQRVSRSREKAPEGDTQREATSTEVTDLRKDVSRQKKSSQRRFLKTVCSKKSVMGSGSPKGEA
jgi:hypothetical protein